MKIATITQYNVTTGEIDGESFNVYWDGEELITKFEESDKEEVLEYHARDIEEAVDITWELYSRGQGYRCQFQL